MRHVFPAWGESVLSSVIVMASVLPMYPEGT
jgi:hypothetical protein